MPLKELGLQVVRTGLLSGSRRRTCDWHDDDYFEPPYPPVLINAPATLTFP